MTKQCDCGCGKPTRLAKNGERKAFVSGHGHRVQQPVPTATVVNPAKTLTRNIGRNYTAEEVDRGMLSLALCGGNGNRASRALAEQGLNVSGRTLRDWREKRPERYQKIADNHARKVEEVIIHQAREIAFKAAEVERLGLEATARQIQTGELQAKDVSSATRNASVSKGINMDQVLKLSGRPTEVVEHRSAEDILRKLSAFKVVTVIDSTATEIKEERPSESNPAEATLEARD